MRELLRDNDLPEPDSVLYGDGEVVFLWHEPKRAVIIELDADPVAFGSVDPEAHRG